MACQPPHYAHIPLILNKDGSKMSKRDQGASLTSYLDNGFLPEAVMNYLCLLGWSPKDNLEKISLGRSHSNASTCRRFSGTTRRFDYEKLLWLQGEYARELAPDRFYELAVHTFAKAGVDTNQFPLGYVKAALDTCKGKFKTFSELPGYAGFYFTDKIEYDAEAVKKDFVPETKPRLEKLRDAFIARPRVQRRKSGSRAQGNRQNAGRESRRAGASLPAGRDRQNLRPQPLPPAPSPRQRTRHGAD